MSELAREINHRHGPKTKRADEPEDDLALELGDGLGAAPRTGREVTGDARACGRATRTRVDVPGR